jgi:hypothetical protein
MSKRLIVVWIELDKYWVHKSFCDDSDELLHSTATENFLKKQDSYHMLSKYHVSSCKF